MSPRFKNYRFYIINALVMAISIIVTCALIYYSARITDPVWLRVFLEIISRILIVYCLFQCHRLIYNMIYIDSFTQGKNGIWVMSKARMLMAKKRLGLYTSLYVNIKEFKLYNQRFDTHVADGILQNYARTISTFVKQHKGYCGRLGGDNFFILIPNTEYKVLTEYLGNVLIEIEYEGEPYLLHLKARMGVSFLTNHSQFRSLIFYANIASVYGKENFVDISVFEPSMLEEYVKEKSIVTDVQRALKENEFIPYYQPKVNVKGNKLSGAEALVRWNKNGKLIPPGDFITALEKAGLIDEVDFAVFEQVCRDIRGWLDRGIEPVRISTNFSKLNLKNPDFVNKIIRIKKRYNIDGKYLEVELTESAGITNFDVIQQFSREIKEAGMSIAIDDFGTGYSSLSMLQTVQADVVKMDKSFLDNCFDDEGDGKQFIVDIITIVRHQNLEVLFEGVETKEQLSFLKEYDCDTIQGFYFDEPLPKDDFEKRLKNPQY